MVPFLICISLYTNGREKYIIFVIKHGLLIPLRNTTTPSRVLVDMVIFKNSNVGSWKPW